MRALFQLSRNRGERRIEFGADAVNRGYNCHGDAAGNDSVLNGRSGGFVPEKGLHLRQHKQP